MNGEIVIAVYRAKPGKAEALGALLDRHQPVLRAAGLVSDRPPVVMRSPKDGTFLEVFEWASAAAAAKAHEQPAVAAIWNEMAAVSDFLTLADVPESTDRFPHFTPHA